MGKGKASWSAPTQSWGKGKTISSAPTQSWGKGKATWAAPTQSWGKGKDKGKGKGKFTTSPFKKIWIGGLPEQEATDRELNKALQEHCKQAGQCINVMIAKNGTGSA